MGKLIISCGDVEKKYGETVKEHTTHYACDCVLNRVHDLETLLSRGLALYKFATDKCVFIQSPEWIRNTEFILRDKLKGVHDDSRIRMQNPRSKKPKKRVQRWVVGGPGM